MGLISIDGRVLKNMFVAGANEITENTPSLNALNVFPVPDGDTGTNMGHTVRAAAKEAMAQATPNIADVAKAASNGALRGARGNSGVILSQLFRGFAKGLEGKTVANSEDLAVALAKSAEMAYKAVMKPKEGTMLTIGRAAAEAAHEIAFDEKDIHECLKFVVEKSDQMLARTPSMLPALKQAGVVDSGGMGIVCFFKGALKSLSIHEDIELLEAPSESAEGTTAGTINPDDIKFAYCTEFLVELSQTHPTGHSHNAEEVLRDYLPTIGDSVVVIEDMGLVKVHVHTNNPGKAMEKALKFGMLINIKIDNMKAQNAELTTDFSTSNEPPKPLGIVAVVSGKGMAELFKGLGADIVIEGGQSMNPSAEDIARAAERVNADYVIILPNNKNITLTASQAGKLVKGKKTGVAATKNIPQGVACLVAFDNTASPEENLEAMNEAMEVAHCGQITQAVRDTVLDDKKIKEGDFLCIYDGDIALVKRNLKTAARALVDHMLKNGGDIVSIFHGEGATAKDAEELGEYVTKKYPQVELELYDGGQPIYSFILSVE
ncbi:MAG: DAK2 domain-containing protein [Defluviitaleaceae bacterium]|nr:DAK2 domain-containing protein [Defluviitaleaceae bacterium]MCL2261912.1 DAK2 domain-containing protein [Defluviitaleaceae bacterium]